MAVAMAEAVRRATGFEPTPPDNVAIASGAMRSKFSCAETRRTAYPYLHCCLSLALAAVVI